MHEENFLSSWLKDDVAEKEERRKKADKETREELSRRGKREVEEKGGRNGWLLQEGVSTLFPVVVLRSTARERIRIVVGVLGVTFWVTLVVCLTVCLRCRRCACCV